MPMIYTGPVSTIQLATQQKVKRAVSGYIDTNAAPGAGGLPTNISAIMYTSTAISVTAINFYTVEAIVGANLKLDVGINGDDNAIADGAPLAAIGAVLIDQVTALAINGSASVAAGKVITASVNVADGTSGTIQVAIEYVEVDV